MEGAFVIPVRWGRSKSVLGPVCPYFLVDPDGLGRAAPAIGVQAERFPRFSGVS
jgi:hypothetical protein